jgi:hypothetical protein
MSFGGANQALDLEIRHFVYRYFVDEMRPPTVGETAVSFHLPLADAQASYQRLHDGHFFFLAPGTTDILMANPFSAVPTNYRAHAGSKSYWANCAWDMLGIPAALHQDARMEAVYEDTRERVELVVENGEVTPVEGIVHFPLPVRRWYDDLILT